MGEMGVAAMYSAMAMPRVSDDGCSVMSLVGGGAHEYPPTPIAQAEGST